MEAKRKKRFFTNHSKSSAMVVSLALHAVLLVVALSFVAVTVITKSEKKFEVKQIDRPRMPPKKLQVPVKIKKQKRKPKLRQRIVVKARVQNMPDIKMPEISGIKGGLGAVGGAGLGAADGIGFSMPEIEVFGVRSKGEKVFIALDSDAFIMRDEVGGMRAYEIIKNELVRIIEGFPPTTLFNLAVFDHGNAVELFPRMVPATRENVAKVEGWLKPLNAVSADMKATDYGVKTIGKGGTPLNLAWDQMADGALAPNKKYGGAGGIRHWCRPVAVAMMQQADTVFILSGWWGTLRRVEGSRAEWKTKDKWDKYVKLAKQKHKEENARRLAKGEPPQVIRDNWQLMNVYYPAERRAYYPPQPPWYYFTARDYAEALRVIRKENAPKSASKSGISKSKRDRFSINTIYFAPKKPKDEAEANSIASQSTRFKTLANRCNGKFRVIKGLEAIESSASH